MSVGSNYIVWCNYCEISSCLSHAQIILVNLLKFYYWSRRVDAKQVLHKHQLYLQLKR